MKLMYMATDEHANWVACPAIDMPRSQERWQASGTFINGGGWVRRSAAGHRVYDMSWNLMPASEIARIRAFFDGVYGSGLLYFIDPVAERTNIFPAAWATPRLGLDGGPTLVYDQEPSREQYPGPNRTYPQVGARYVLTGDSIVNTLKIPVPERHRLHFKAGYTNPSSAAVENARQALLDALAAYTDAPVQWSATAPGDTSVVWVDPGTGVGRVWSAGVGGSVDDVVTRRNLFYPGTVRNLALAPGGVLVSGIAYRSVTAPAVPGQAYGVRRSEPLTNRFRTVFAAEEPAVDVEYFGGSGNNSGTDGDVEITSIAPEGAAFLLVYMSNSHDDVERLLIEPGGPPGDYFDGDTPDHRTDDIIYRYAWEDTPHASPSTETALGRGWYEITDPDVVAAGQAYADALTDAEGSAELCYRHNNGDWTPMRSIQHSVTGPGWAGFSLQGIGAVNVFWMQGVILPVEEEPNFRDFHPGQGNSGVDFEDFQEHTHSVGIDKHGASVRLREVASWL